MKVIPRIGVAFVISSLYLSFGEMKDWKRQLSFAFVVVMLLTLFQSGVTAQEEAKRPKKLRSKIANTLLRKFSAAERDLRKTKQEQDRESLKAFSKSHKELREELVAELKKNLTEETKGGNLDSALEIRSAIQYFEKMNADDAMSGTGGKSAKELALENQSLRAKVVDLETRLAGGKPPVSKPGANASDHKNGIGMHFKLIPSGNFMMGASEDKVIALFKGVQRGSFAHELPKHKVRISKPFYMGMHEVTVGQFRKFVEATNYVTKAELRPGGGWGYDGKGKFVAGKDYSWKNTGFEQDDNQPVVNVCWHDAVEFCKWLSREENVEYSLPTEAQWEYACRGGQDFMFYAGEDPGVLMSIANIADATLNPKLTTDIRNRLTDGCAFTSSVGQYSPNEFGLYDMVGNVNEWCQDRHSRDYYKQSPFRDPTGAKQGTNRVTRGGGFQASTWACRSAERPMHGASPDHCAIDLGFRVVRVSKK